MKPVFKIGNHDYTAFLADDGLQPVRNDLDADGSGRNLLDGLMLFLFFGQQKYRISHCWNIG